MLYGNRNVHKFMKVEVRLQFGKNTFERYVFTMNPIHERLG